MKPFGIILSNRQQRVSNNHLVPRSIGTSFDRLITSFFCLPIRPPSSILSNRCSQLLRISSFKRAHSSTLKAKNLSSLQRCVPRFKFQTFRRWVFDHFISRFASFCASLLPHCPPTHSMVISWLFFDHWLMICDDLLITCWSLSDCSQNTCWSNADPALIVRHFIHDSLSFEDKSWNQWVAVCHS